MMVTANCIRKLAGGCLKEKGKRAGFGKHGPAAGQVQDRIPQWRLTAAIVIILSIIPSRFPSCLSGRNCGKRVGAVRMDFLEEGCGGCPGEGLLFSACF